jgi:hypothetical protein
VHAAGPDARAETVVKLIVALLTFACAIATLAAGLYGAMFVLQSLSRKKGPQ